MPVRGKYPDRLYSFEKFSVKKKNGLTETKKILKDAFFINSRGTTRKKKERLITLLHQSSAFSTTGENKSVIYEWTPKAPSFPASFLFLPRESTLVAASHVSMYTNQIHTEGGSLT